MANSPAKPGLHILPPNSNFPGTPLGNHGRGNFISYRVTASIALTVILLLGCLHNWPAAYEGDAKETSMEALHHINNKASSAEVIGNLRRPARAPALISDASTSLGRSPPPPPPLPLSRPVPVRVPSKVVNEAGNGRSGSKDTTQGEIPQGTLGHTRQNAQQGAHDGALAPVKMGSPSSASPKSVLLFTMDSITQYKTSASKGGPAGEIIIRRALTEMLESLFPRAKISVASSDEEMIRLGNSGPFDVYVFDPWTWAGPGWVLREFIVDPRKLFILDFFGSETSYTKSGEFVMEAHPSRRARSGDD